VNLATVRSALAAIAVAAAAASLAGQTPQKWRVQYFYDEEKATLRLVDLQFPSAQRGVAVGTIVEGTRQKHVAVLTADGGAHWQLTNIEEAPVSLFFLRENLGWMVTTKGLWQTTETGRNWRKLPKLPGQVIRVAFTDEKTGYAAGVKKKAFQTKDGGQTWQPIAAAAEPPGNPDYSAYTWVAFPNAKSGIITGYNLPPRRDQLLPDWLDPEAASKRRDVPHLSYALETHDGGATWDPKSVSLFGQVTRLRYNSQGVGIGLIEYGPSFRYPAEAYRVESKTGKSQTIYRDRRFAITDVWLDDSGGALLAGTQVVGQIRNVVPGKVQVLHTKDFLTWEDMPVDYRAVANRVVLAAPDSKNMWLATDAGMILKYQ
jgi:photosystem II stability/assembly factor-like uncharacterized protein